MSGGISTVGIAALDAAPPTPRAKAGPAAPPDIADRFPARLDSTVWPQTKDSAERIVALVEKMHPWADTPQVRNHRRRGVILLLNLLAPYPGATWQHKWLASGLEDTQGRQWQDALTQRVGEHRYAHWQIRQFPSALTTLICADVLRPRLPYLLTRNARGLVGAMAALRDPDGFDLLRRECRSLDSITPTAEFRILRNTALLLARHGGGVRNITVGDCVQLIRSAHSTTSEATMKGHTAFYSLLRRLGIFPDDAPDHVRALYATPGRQSVEQLVDRYHIECTPVRDLLIAYLRERQPALDYITLAQLSYMLASLFWRDLERHHPGVNSLDLPAEWALAWKERLHRKPTKQSTTDTGATTGATTRASALACLLAVRALYLDLAQWALEEPQRWAAWAVPCPVRPADVRGTKTKTRTKARMDQRTRELLPSLPDVVRTVDARRLHCAALLSAASDATPGSSFTCDGALYTRLHKPHAAGTKIWVSDTRTGTVLDASQYEQETFWAWATVEILRNTGIRIEELLELNHYAFVQYRLPTTGELVPLLQITPSKTDAERLLLITPELADVLSAVVRRIRTHDGGVPLISAYDPYEKIWLPPMPLLFQRPVSGEHRAFSGATIRDYLAKALAAALPPGRRTPVHLTPHDFRRFFVTDALLNGLPPHLAQIICGHRDINTTMGYKAVYPHEAIEAHRAFIARRRATRPSEEYRTPTDTEWDEFLGHFEHRKVSLGTCGRAYQAPCIHEHACIRCPVLRPDPRQRHRLDEIRTNLIDRITEAEREGWLGEVEGLKVSLAAAENKLADLDAHIHKTKSAHLGMPAFGRATT
ncbi:site-specific integrase [Streptomyces sp. 769]|uniref:site-specific integrase n=1 Tax=Streptomyces sp. 769 TaxID=1262452 RepID=UPI000581EF0B|nr:site-specific integrase [Streptomyces sp. 769]AJC59522.1 putative DNA integrase/recombinase [Streptomyces sp. 769]